MLNQNIDWEAVIGVLQQRFPRELDIAMLTAHAARLEQRLQEVSDGGHEDDGADGGSDPDE